MMDSQIDNIETPTKSEGRESFHSVSADFFQRAKIYDVEEGRESLMLLRESLIEDIGRESLGIIQLNLAEERLSDTNWLNVPNINVEEIPSSTDTPHNTSMSSILNRGFLYQSRTSPVSVSISSYNSIKSSINSERFGSSELSSIGYSDSSDVLNKGFVNSYSNDRRYSTELSSVRNRLCSLPVIVENKEKLDSCPAQITKSVSKIRRSLNLPLLDDEDDDISETDSQFNDSVFIEAQMIAIKISDGSLLEETGALGLLDSTPQPELVDDELEDSNTDIKITSEDIFKRVDKLLPICNFPNTEKTDEDTKENETNKSPELSNNNEVILNLSNIFQNNSVSRSLSTSKLSNCSGKSRSRDAKEILENLSVILSNENPTTQQKTEGQNLLYTLADILCDSKNSSKSRETLDDSGHSSIEMEHVAETQNDPKFVDITDLRMKPLCDNTQPLDLSTGTSQQTLNRSLSCPTAQSEIKLKKTSDNSSILKRISKSQASLSKINSFGKLKSKKTEDPKKKGPLRAILPIGNMARVITKSKTMVIPPKPHASSLYKSKTTSTPEKGPNYCPVAQSTPDANPNEFRKVQVSPSQLPKPKFNCPVSPLARPALKESRNIPISTHNSHNASLNRRKSASDIKPLNNSVGLRRSNSISKDSNVSSAVSRVRDSILRHSKETAVDKKNNKIDVAPKPSQMDRLKNSVKPFNLMSKMRRSAGKENADH